MERRKNLKKTLSVALYALPAVFFIICYFWIITSGEDIFQGAHTAPDIVSDALAAFNHSARLADMYAWAVINFFDYSYSFGVDTIFRIIDVLAAYGIFYLAAYLALGRRPKMKLSDAAVFSAIFLMVFLTSNGLTLYAGFSKIHNYLIIGGVSLLFLLAYFKDAWGGKLPEGKWFILAMWALGVIFGLASNVTAVVFLICLVIYTVYLGLTRQKVPVRKFFLSWRGAGVAGSILGLFIIYVIGPGLAGYEDNPIYQSVCDYLSFGEIFSNFWPSIGRIIMHNGYNFGRFLAPFMVISVFVAGYGLRRYFRGELRRPKFSQREKNYLVLAGVFVVVHILALSQIYYPTRLVLPAYLVAAAMVLYVARKIFGEMGSVPLAMIMMVLMVGIIAVRVYFTATYHARIVPILEEIRETDAEVYCVDIKTATAESLPYIHLGQEDFLVDWAMPQTIYGKTVVYCE